MRCMISPRYSGDRALSATNRAGIDFSEGQDQVKESQIRFLTGDYIRLQCRLGQVSKYSMS